jgi:hypothetical protein
MQLVRLVTDYPDDTKLADLLLTTLSHSLPTVTSAEPPDTREIRALDVAGILRALVPALRHPGAASEMLWHAHDLVLRAAFNCADEVRQSGLQRYMVAFLRSEDMGVRCRSLQAIVQLHAKSAEQDRTKIDPRRFAEAASGRWPDDVRIRRLAALLLTCQHRWST